MDASKLIGYDGIFATRLRALMKNSKATQQDVAAAVGTTRQAISQYADGSVQPNIEKLYRMADFFKVSADYLVGLSDIASVEMDDKAIAEKIGLSDKAISALRDEKEVVNLIRQSKDFPLVANVAYPTKVSIVNLLLEEHNGNGQTMLELLRLLFAYNKDLKEAPQKHYDVDPQIKLLFSYGDKVDKYSFVPTDEEAFAVLLLRLQQRVSRYKDEIDQTVVGGK